MQVRTEGRLAARIGVHFAYLLVTHSRFGAALDSTPVAKL